MIRRSATILLTLLALSDRSAHASDAIVEGQWFHQFLRVAEANMISAGGGVTLAIVDSGVDATHPDLLNSILAGTDLTAVGGNGQVDTDGHGTAMAGLIVGHGRVKGVAPAAKVLPIRAGKTIEGSVSNLAQGINWAVANGATIVSISGGTQEDDLLLRQAVENALKASVVIVAAVGNLPDSNRIQYPAAIPGVLAVAGVDRSGDHSKISIMGAKVDISAPAEHISSTGPNHTHVITNGTSDATAIVAGAVALVRAKYPDLKAPEVIRRLTATATDRGAPGRDDEYGYGVLNIVAALTAELPAETTAPAVASRTGLGAEPPAGPGAGGGRLGWWLLAILPAVAVGVVGFIWWRRRRVERDSTGE